MEVDCNGSCNVLTISVAQESGKGREKGAHAAQNVGQCALEDAMAFFGMKPGPCQKGSSFDVVYDDAQAVID